MIIRLKTANFSDNNIGELNKFTIYCHGTGLASSEFTSPVDKGATATIKVKLNSGFSTSDIKVTMKGASISPSISSTGTNEYTITVNNVTGRIDVRVGDVIVDDSSTNYNDADMWVAQTISATGAVSTTGITQSNIMAKDKFTEEIVISVKTSSTFRILIAQVTYNADGSFKERSSWVTLDPATATKSMTYNDANPYNVVIATSGSSSLSVSELLNLIDVRSAT